MNVLFTISLPNVRPCGAVTFLASRDKNKEKNLISKSQHKIQVHTGVSGSYELDRWNTFWL
jgi:hypothetical protein